MPSKRAAAVSAKEKIAEVNDDMNDMSDTSENNVINNHNKYKDDDSNDDDDDDDDIDELNASSNDDDNDNGNHDDKKKKKKTITKKQQQPLSSKKKASTTTTTTKAKAKAKVKGTTTTNNRKKTTKTTKTKKGEQVQSKSPAEFFAENQNIAGFDNPGKSLFTTIRELVENSLDASESIKVLPEIKITLVEMNEMEFNSSRGYEFKESNDVSLFKKKGGGVPRRSSMDNVANNNLLTQENSSSTDPLSTTSITTTAIDVTQTQTQTLSQPTPLVNNNNNNNNNNKDNSKKQQPGEYFKITCEDNGCGMPDSKIPNMLGKVLSGSKYGVRQSRGKFGLGSKMALIWSKKSTGMPIEIYSAHTTNADVVPEFISHYVLDIDIYKNEPNVISHEKIPNDEGIRGTKMIVTIGGKFVTYKSYLEKYLQQLAIITPYAAFEFDFECIADPRKNFTSNYQRRSEKMPEPAQEVKYHPSSVNNLIVQSLLDHSKAKTLVKFLSTDLSSISPTIAKRIIAAMGDQFSEKMSLDLNMDQITRLTQILKEVTLFKDPDGSCLSPAGEYNLRLGILKEVEPEFVATCSQKCIQFEGHPFIIEAGVSIGGKNGKEGDLNIFRYANRIPLLFEAGNDVVTKVSKGIKWKTLYKIDPKSDRVGVFVSIVSTKIPFKGTGKEYIGDDITPIHNAVKAAIMKCCNQLKAHLQKRNHMRDQRERRKNMLKYIPDVSRAVFGVLESIKKREEEKRQSSDSNKRARTSTGAENTPEKKRKLLSGAILDDWAKENNQDIRLIKTKLLTDIYNKELSTDILEERLKTAVEKVDHEIALEAAASSGTDSNERFIIAPLQPSKKYSHQLENSMCRFSLFSNAFISGKK